MARFVRKGSRSAGRTPVELDPTQRAAVDLRDAQSAAVIGAAGSGKTLTVIELVADRVLNRGWSPDEILVLAPSRASATELRDRLAARLQVPTSGPLARTVNSVAFELVRDAPAAPEAPAPVLLTGAEQDQIIAELLEGELGEGFGASWPEHLGAEVRQLRGFRTELRDLMMRAIEQGISAQRLAELGRLTGRAEWEAGASFIETYDRVKASFRDRHLDSTELVREAAVIVASGAPTALKALRLIVLDDAQESTESTVTLLRAFASRGVAVIAVGDPDLTTGTFRGAQPEFLARLGSRLGLNDVQTLVLSQVHRHGDSLRQTIASITGRIGAAGAGLQRKAGAVELAQAVELATPAQSHAQSFLLGSPAEEVAFIARRLRECHVHDGMAWSQMAVIVRSSAMVPVLARQLHSLEVPTRVSGASSSVRAEPAVAALTLALAVALGIRVLDRQTAEALLTGPLGRLDPVGLRRLKAALRHEELAGAGDRASGDLLVEALDHPAGFTTIETRVGRLAARLSSNLAETREASAREESIEDLLWGLWQRSGLEQLWFEQAVGSGVAAEEANRHLDGVVALFSAAKRFAERSPGAPASVFLGAWLTAEVAEDSLAPRSMIDAVALGTPAAMLGQEFSVVVVAGLQENVWPNLRLRGSLFASNELAAAHASIPGGTVAASGQFHDAASSSAGDARTEVMHDELRLFAQAISRARTRAIVTAVSGDDNMPSPFLRLVPAGETRGLETYPLSLRGLVGRARRELAGSSADAAASALARLAAEGVPGAHPDEWYGMRAASTVEPLTDLSDDDAVVRVSPSRMDAFETCALHWFIGEVAGGSSNLAANLGTIIHEVAENAHDETAEALLAAVEARWGELSFETEWQSQIERKRAAELTRRLAAYLRDVGNAGAQLLQAEPSFELAVGQARLRGKIDRVEQYPDGTAVIVDLKTGKNEPTTDAGVADNPQLGAYQLAFATGSIEGLPDGLASGGAKLVIVSKGNRAAEYLAPAQAAFTAEQLESFRQRVLGDARGMAGAVFVAQLGSHCLDPFKFGQCSIHVVPAVSAG
jgi:superfamily I DNA/RNA helicase/RecB family exonuclease